MAAAAFVAAPVGLPGDHRPALHPAGHRPPAARPAPAAAAAVATCHPRLTPVASRPRLPDAGPSATPLRSASPPLPPLLFLSSSSSSSSPPPPPPPSPPRHVAAAVAAASAAAAAVRAAVLPPPPVVAAIAGVAAAAVVGAATATAGLPSSTAAAAGVPPASAAEAGAIIGQIPTSGLLFKDSIVVHGVGDPKISGVRLYVADASRRVTDRLANPLAQEPGSAAVTCLKVGHAAVVAGTAPSEAKEGEEVFTEARSFGWANKSVRVVRLLDPATRSVVYVSFSSRVLDTKDDNRSRFASSLCAIQLDE